MRSFHSLTFPVRGKTAVSLNPGKALRKYVCINYSCVGTLPAGDQQHSFPIIWNVIEAVQRYYIQNSLLAIFPPYIIDKVSNSEAKEKENLDDI